MAKKRTRKSRRARRRPSPVTRPTTEKHVETRPSQTATPEPTQIATQPSPASARGVRRTATDFVSEYSYVYFDLRKMFTIALIMFVLLILTNLVLTRMIVF